eukprot:4655523-Lingulodinium_polyedra.AAC.1
MTLEEYRQRCQTTAQQQTVQGGSGNAPAKKGEGGDATPQPLDSGIWANFVAKGQEAKATEQPGKASI